MRLRRAITAVGATALLGLTLPVVAAAPAFAACGDADPPCAVVDESVGTAKEVIDNGFGTSSTDTATFAFTVAGSADRITYECQLERNGVVTQPFAACTSPVSYPGLTDAGYRFSVRATRQPAVVLGIPLGGPVVGAADTFVWDVELPAGGTGGVPNTLIGNVPKRWSTDNWFSVDLLSGSAATSYVCRLDGQVRTCDTGRTDDMFNVFGIGAGDHTLSVAAVGAGGKRDTTPATARFTVPRIATKLRGLRGGWSKVRRVQGPMADQVLVATRKGASIKHHFTKQRSLAVVVTKAPGSGKLRVYLDGRRIKVVDLSSPSVRYRQVVRLATFTKRTTGNVVLVTSNNKPVRVEGLGLSAF